MSLGHIKMDGIDPSNILEPGTTRTTRGVPPPRLRSTPGKHRGGIGDRVELLSPGSGDDRDLPSTGSPAKIKVELSTLLSPVLDVSTSPGEEDYEPEQGQEETGQLQAFNNVQGNHGKAPSINEEGAEPFHFPVRDGDHLHPPPLGHSSGGGGKDDLPQGEVQQGAARVNTQADLRTRIKAELNQIRISIDEYSDCHDQLPDQIRILIDEYSAYHDRLPDSRTLVEMVARNLGSRLTVLKGKAVQSDDLKLIGLVSTMISVLAAA